MRSTKRRRKSASDDNYQAPALTKGLEVLEFLSLQTEPHAISSLARSLGKSRNEIYRMVIVLERLGYLVRSDSDRYVLSRKLFDVAMRTPPERNLLSAALPEMQSLADQTNQSCHLTVASESDIVVVARIESPATLGFSVRVGHRLPINDSASGRVLFSFQNERTRNAWRSRLQTKRDRALWAECERKTRTIRQSGSYLSPSPYVDAVTDIAAPILHGPEPQAVAALVMPYIGGRSAKITLSDAAAATVSVAGRISQRLN